MLLEFRFSNFRSFLTQQALSLTAASIRSGAQHVIELAKYKDQVLPFAAIYGGNGSGKTNVLKALQFYIQTVRQSFNRWEPNAPVPIPSFKGEEKQPSRFEADWVFDGNKYSYRFCVNQERVLNEALYAYPNGREQRWFSREDGAPMYFGPALSGPNKVIEQLTRANSLFLSAAAQHGHEQLGQLQRRIVEGVEFVTQERNTLLHHSQYVGKYPELREQVLRLIREADLGITGLAYGEKPIFASEEQARLYRAYVQSFAGEAIEIPLELSRPELRFRHRFGGGEGDLDFDDESNGTKHFLGLLPPVIYARSKGVTLVVDELDSGLHSDLVRAILKLFVPPKKATSAAQIIFNTHDVQMQEWPELRRDEIWLVDKSYDGVSSLRSLADFSVRNDANIRRGYVSGRYGGVPSLDENALVRSLDDD